MPAPRRTTRPVSDPRAWRALAHPLRLQILYHLQTTPAARATDLGNALQAPANSVSFHLRQLERYGYVERDDSPRADARERWWRTTSPTGFRVEHPEQDPAAATELAEVMRSQARDQLDTWYDAVQVPADEWPEGEPRTSNFDVHLALTPEDRDGFLGELGELFERWLDRSRAGSGDDREEYVMFGYGLPQWAYDEARRRRRGEG